MSKCLGCGSILQDQNTNKEGYVKDLNAKLCERCFKIKNYGEYKPVIKEEQEFITLLDTINKTNDLVVLVCDLFNFNPNLELIKKHLTNDILLVLTKRDLLPKSLFEDKLLNYLNNIELNIVDRVIVSSFNNYNFDSLYEKINTYKKSNNVYVVGFTNAGKSTLINKLLYNYGNLDINITTSILPNTTIDNIELVLNDNLTLIDTPGILDDGSIYYLKDIKELKRILPKTRIKPKTYQIRNEQIISVEDLFELELKNNNVTLFIANNLKVTRKYNKESNKQLEKHIILVNKNEDIVISGLGFIKFTKKEDIVLYTIKGIKIYKRKSLI